MKIFEPDFNITSTKKPIAKMIISVLVIISLINRGYIIDIKSRILREIVGMICALIVVFCVLCIYISIAELINLWEKKSDAKIDFANVKTTKYSVDELVQMAGENDILIVKLVYKGQLIKAGASSALNPGSSEFFDKQYYIEEQEFASIDEFEVALSQYTCNGKLNVFYIE